MQERKTEIPVIPTWLRVVVILITPYPGALLPSKKATAPLVSHAALFHGLAKHLLESFLLLTNYAQSVTSVAESSTSGCRVGDYKRGQRTKLLLLRSIILFVGGSRFGLHRRLIDGRGRGP
jgi:hypothetical protein